MAAHRLSVVRESSRQLAGRASMLSHASCSCFVPVAERARLRHSETQAPLDQGRQDRRTGVGPGTEEMKLRGDELRKEPAVERLTTHGATPLSASRRRPEMRDRCIRQVAGQMDRGPVIQHGCPGVAIEREGEFSGIERRGPRRVRSARRSVAMRRAAQSGGGQGRGEPGHREQPRRTADYSAAMP